MNLKGLPDQVEAVTRVADTLVNSQAAHVVYTALVMWLRSRGDLTDAQKAELDARYGDGLVLKADAEARAEG